MQVKKLQLGVEVTKPMMTLRQGILRLITTNYRDQALRDSISRTQEPSLEG